MNNQIEQFEFNIQKIKKSVGIKSETRA